MVVVMRGRTAALGLALLCLACGSRSHTPGETVGLYLRWLAQDPIRTLPLLSPGFHAEHGLEFEDFREPPAGSELLARSTRVRIAPPAREGPVDEGLALARARLGWLTALSRPVFRETVPQLSIVYEDEQIQEDRARVGIRVEQESRIPFAVTFHLSREQAGTAWRIDGIEVQERPRRLLAAFLIAPTAERWRRIQAIRERRGRPPDGDRRESG
jgi:hypothetical protein